VRAQRAWRIRDRSPRPLLILNYGFTSNEAEEMTNAVVALRCVLPDADSPTDCAPDSDDCADPRRENNAPCPYLTIAETAKTVGSIPPGAGLSANFTVVMQEAISGTPEVELVLEVTAAVKGKTSTGVSVNRVTLNADESSTLYSTDYPMGGTEQQDRNNNEWLDNPLTVSEPVLRDDLRFETVVYSAIFGTSGTKNQGLQSPWNFDLDDGGFQSGLSGVTDILAITDNVTNWGEDLNFNDQLDWFCSLDESLLLPGGRPGCDPDNDQCLGMGAGICTSFEDRDEHGVTDELDRNWSTAGGCGWQTRAPGSCSTTSGQACYGDADCPATESCDTGAGPSTGGAWHTGTIGSTGEAACLAWAGRPGQCEFFDTVGGDTGRREWTELLMMPEIQRVGGDEVRVEITNWAWNMTVDLPDNNAWFTWEFDNDTRLVEPVELFADLEGAFQASGPFGAVTGGPSGISTRGWGLFAPLSADGAVSENGSIGNNRVGDNGCFFEGNLTDEALRNSARCEQSVQTGCLPITIAHHVDGLADPPDDDLKNGACTHDRRLSCRRACSEDPLKPCNDDADCVGTCDADGSADCVDPTTTCTVDGDCTDAAGGRCVGYAGTCTVWDGAGRPVPCLFHDDCEGFLNFCINKVNSCTYPCEFGGSAIDEYVTPAGPIRNFDLQAFDGPDLRYDTLEDFQGPTGEFFRGAIGFRAREPAPNAGDAIPSFGLAIDDMVVEWREFVRVEDQTDCAPMGGTGPGGSCAALDAATSSLFEGSGLITVTVVETSPSPNDCDEDGSPDVPDDFDCDDDGTPDVVVEASSLGDATGERVVANRTGAACACEYRGVLPVSTAYDVAGVLFLQPNGGLSAQATLTYLDLDDGTGQPCANDPTGASPGRVVTNVAVLVTAGNLRARLASVDDGGISGTHGDGDGIPDTNETVALRIEVTNATGLPLEGVIARLSTNDPTIDCILDAQLSVGDLPASDPSGADPSVVPADPFRFRVADVDREGSCSITTSQVCRLDADCPASELCTAAFERLDAEFTVTFSSSGRNAIAAAAIPQRLTLDLDLDFSGGDAPSSYTEDFEIDPGGFGSFVSMNLDATLGSNSAADGYRCQYTDPDWPNSNLYGGYESEWQCYPGPATVHGPAHRQKFWWQINSADPNGPPSPDDGRAFSGLQSLYYGEYGPAPDENTTPVGVLEAIATLEPINLGWAAVCAITRTAPCSTDDDCTAAALGNACVASACSLSGIPCSDDAGCDESCVAVQPQLSFKQQISLMDNPPHGCVGPVQGAGRTADRAVLQAQLAGPDDPTPDLAPGVGPWMKLEPFLNGYEIQSEDNFLSCSFDPIDDGSTEDDFFDPTDPDRRLGPSSTCFPEFVWAASGDTGDAFDATNIWRADGPGLEGSAGIGTWVETRVDLSRFRGQRLRLRFLVSGLHDPTAWTWEELFAPLNPNDCDDGWWIDDLQVTDTLTTPATVTADVRPNDDPLEFPPCGPACGTVTARLDADPVATASAPLTAPGHAVELDAGASFADRCTDGVLQYRFWRDDDGDGQGGGTTDALLRDWTDNPVLVRAPSETARFVVDVRCSGGPGCSGSAARTVVVDCPASGALGGGIFQTLTAPDKTRFVWSVPADVTFASGMLADLPAYLPNATGTLAAATELPAAAAEWYLAKSAGEFCNQEGAWSSGGAGEIPGRDLPGGLP
jgi:hypothetical protein